MNSTFQVTKQVANDQMRKNLALASALSGGGNHTPRHSDLQLISLNFVLKAIQNVAVSVCCSQALFGPLVPHPLGELGCLMGVTWQEC